MAGHSHWAGIKHKKAREDKKRGKLFSKLSKLIIVAARNGGGDPEINFKLRHAIEQAKAANMPKENIERAIKRGTGELEGVDYEEIIYEGVGPEGVNIILDVLTDSRNRTVSELRKIFENHDGSMDASVAWNFAKKGQFIFSKNGEGVDEETLTELALEGGAEDLQVEEETMEITTEPEDFENMKNTLEKAGVKWEEAEVTYLPETTMTLEGKLARKTYKLLETLDDHDDVQNVYTNAEFAEDMEEDKE